MTSIERLCSVSGCQLKLLAKGYCQNHYQSQIARKKPGFTYPKRNADQKRQQADIQKRKRDKLRQSDPAAYAARVRAEVLWTNHRLRPEQYDEQFARQGGVCAICAKSCNTGRRLAVDHDHACHPAKKSCPDCWRGLLCGNCNQGLGKFMDSPDLLLAAVAYLESGGVWKR